MGEELCNALTPSDNLAEVTAWQQETEEAVVVLTYYGGHPLMAFQDVRAHLAMCDKGATLSTRALLQVAEMMRASRAARDVLVTDRENTPMLRGRAEGLCILRNVEQDITDAIISEDEIADRASSELMNIRRHLRGATERIKEKHNPMIRNAAMAK